MEKSHRFNKLEDKKVPFYMNEINTIIYTVLLACKLLYQKVSIILNLVGIDKYIHFGSLVNNVVTGTVRLYTLRFVVYDCHSGI